MINVRDEEGCTSLQRAVMAMSPKCAEVPPRAGADRSMLFPAMLVPGSHGDAMTPLRFSNKAFKAAKRRSDCMDG